MSDRSRERYYRGTRANLQPGDLIETGYNSNFGSGNGAKYVYLTATADAAVWGAELATGEGPGRIYVVEPTGPIEDDPNLTDKKFPGNPTRPSRTALVLRYLSQANSQTGKGMPPTSSGP
jgi:rifampin ADP-ribosylating transferase